MKQIRNACQAHWALTSNVKWGRNVDQGTDEAKVSQVMEICDFKQRTKAERFKQNSKNFTKALQDP